MPSVCTFALNKPTPVYFSGETIVGTATVENTSAKDVNDVSILFLGIGKVKWEESESSSSDSFSSTVYYKGDETYINNKTKVHDGGVLPAGIHTYTFHIHLPWECPTSCEGQYGHIRYEISLIINRTYGFDNVYKKAITVIKTMDLNLNPVYKLPFHLETSKSAWFWPFSNGKVFYYLKIPFRAYASGQTIKYALQIVNQSMNDCEGYRIELSQKTTFIAKSPRRKERNFKNILAEKSYSIQCLRLTNRIFEGEFVIPATAPTADDSNIICVRYTLKYTVLMSGCISNCHLKAPLVIGTIPLRESLATNELSSNDEQPKVSPTAPEMPMSEDQSAASTSTPSYDGIRPPTFAEATRSGSPFIDTDIDENNRTVGFQPLYPVYNNLTKE